MPLPPKYLLRKSIKITATMSCLKWCSEDWQTVGNDSSPTSSTGLAYDKFRPNCTDFKCFCLQTSTFYKYPSFSVQTSIWVRSKYPKDFVFFTLTCVHWRCDTLKTCKKNVKQSKTGEELKFFFFILQPNFVPHKNVFGGSTG